MSDQPYTNKTYMCSKCSLLCDILGLLCILFHFFGNSTIRSLTFGGGGGSLELCLPDGGGLAAREVDGAVEWTHPASVGSATMKICPLLVDMTFGYDNKSEVVFGG